jgi:hypothetical protein
VAQVVAVGLIQLKPLLLLEELVVLVVLVEVVVVLVLVEIHLVLVALEALEQSFFITNF